MNNNFFFIINSVDFFISHRLPIAIKLINNGYNVHLISGYYDHHNIQVLRRYKIRITKLNIHRSSITIFNDFISFFKIFFLLIKYKPKIIHLVTIKPIILAGFISRILNINTVIAITGLNFVDYIDIKLSKFYLRPLKKIFYFFLKFSLNNKNSKIIVQNKDDKNFINKLIKYNKKNKIILINGSGVDLNLFKFSECSYSKTPIILFPSRMLWDKGVYEFVKSGEIINRNNIKAKFILVGPFDQDNTKKVPLEYLKNLSKKKGIEWIGNTKNIAEIITKSSIIVFPSYREGFPKILQEVAAIGRVIITTNTSGCRDAIDKKTGFLVEIKEYDEIVNIINNLLNNYDLIKSMGKNARLKAENEFNIDHIIDRHLLIYKSFSK